MGAGLSLPKPNKMRWGRAWKSVRDSSMASRFLAWYRNQGDRQRLWATHKAGKDQTFNVLQHHLARLA